MARISKSSTIHALTVALLLGGVSAVFAAPTQPDLVDSPECKAATARFDAAFAELKDRKPATTPKLDDARRQAALACFGKAEGGPGGSSAPATSASVGTRSPYPPVTVPQANAAARRPLAPVPSATAVPQAAVKVDRPSFITSCDGNGCSTSDGQRLNRVGTDLVGARGLCSVQGNVATCP